MNDGGGGICPFYEMFFLINALSNRPQGATLMVVLLSRRSRTSIRTSRFCQILVEWTSSFLACTCAIVYNIHFWGGGQVSESSGQVQISFCLSGRQVLKIPNVTPCAYKLSFRNQKNEAKTRELSYVRVQKCIEVNGHQLADFRWSLGGCLICEVDL